MKMFPVMCCLVAATFGWGIGRPLGRFASILFALVLGTLGFYYARQYIRQLFS
jgi:hypothetical protein